MRLSETQETRLEKNVLQDDRVRLVCDDCDDTVGEVPGIFLGLDGDGERWCDSTGRKKGEGTLPVWCRWCV